MTGEVTFGELLDGMHWHLNQAASGPRLRSGRDLPDVATAMHLLALAIGRCLRDYGRRDCATRPDNAGPASSWWTARARARQAAVLAARQLQPSLPGDGGAERACERGRHVQAAAQMLAAGSDLLASHFEVDIKRVPFCRSAWGPAVCSVAVSRALCAEMGELAWRAASIGRGMVSSAPARSDELGKARRDVAVACRHLRLLAAAVRDLRLRDPVPEDDLQLLRAIPAVGLGARRRHEGRQPVDELSAGVIAAAERLRLSTWAAAERAGWSPSVSAESLRYAAADGVAVYDQCAGLLRSLREQARPSELAAALTGAAEVADAARDGWLRAYRTLDQVSSDVRGHAGPEAADAKDLAMSTRQLAQIWLALATAGADGEQHAELPVTNPTAGPAHVTMVVEAVHYACDAMSRLGELHARQARAAARAGRFLAPSWSLPDYYDRSRPYGPAPTDRLDAVLSAYRQVREAGAACEAQVGEVAELACSPSRALTLARKAVAGPSRAEHADEPGLDGRSGGALPGYPATRLPGHVEMSLSALGIADPRHVRAAQSIDLASEQLITTASAERLAELQHLVRMPQQLGGSRHHRDVTAHGLTASVSRGSPERQPE